MSDFWATGMSGILAPVDSKNVPQSLRQRLALAMLMQRKQFPKTLGEGLSSIGDDIAQAMMARGVMGDAAKAEAAGTAFEDRIRDPDATASPNAVRSYAPADANTVAPAGGLLPARTMPPDEQQSDEPGAPIRMPSAEAVDDWAQGQSPAR